MSPSEWSRCPRSQSCPTCWPPSTTSTPPAGIAIQLVTDQTLVAAVSRDHPLAQRKTITLRALAQRKLISLPLGTGMRTYFDQACAAAGVRPHILFEASDPATLDRTST